MSDRGVAIVCTYLPEEDRVYHTPFFESDGCPDPVLQAQNFCNSEEERGDFPGAVWGVILNDRAREIMATQRMVRWLGISEAEAREVVSGGR